MVCVHPEVSKPVRYADWLPRRRSVCPDARKVRRIWPEEGRGVGTVSWAAGPGRQSQQAGENVGWQAPGGVGGNCWDAQGFISTLGAGWYPQGSGELPSSIQPPPTALQSGDLLFFLTFPLSFLVGRGPGKFRASRCLQTPGVIKPSSSLCQLHNRAPSPLAGPGHISPGPRPGSLLPCWTNVSKKEGREVDMDGPALLSPDGPHLAGWLAKESPGCETGQQPLVGTRGMCLVWVLPTPPRPSVALAEHRSS